MFVILLFGWYLHFLFLNMFFTMFSCTFNKNNSKICKFGPFLAQNGNFKPLTLNNFDVCYFAFWLVQDFLIENFLFTFLSICSLQCFHVHLIKIIPKSVNLAPFWPKTGILNLWLWIILMFVILLFGWYKTSLLKISYLHSQYVLYNVFMYI